MKECYGRMFPELPELRQVNHTASGKIFQARISSVGPFQREPHLALNLEAWEECLQCPHYQACHDLSNARLAMQQALYRNPSVTGDRPLVIGSWRMSQCKSLGFCARN